MRFIKYNEIAFLLFIYQAMVCREYFCWPCARQNKFTSLSDLHYVYLVIWRQNNSFLGTLFFLHKLHCLHCVFFIFMRVKGIMQILLMAGKSIYGVNSSLEYSMRRRKKNLFLGPCLNRLVSRLTYSYSSTVSHFFYSFTKIPFPLSTWYEVGRTDGR